MKHKDNKLNKELQYIFDGIDGQTGETVETLEEQEVRKKHLLTNYKEFVGYYFESYMPKGRNTTAWFHEEAANLVIANKDGGLLNYQLARGHGKSVTFGIFIPCFLMLKSDLNYFVLVGNNQNRAEELLDSLKKELLRNHKLRHDYGAFFHNEHNISSDKFIANVNNREIMFQALGAGGSVRGLRYKAQRPDFVLLDDCGDKSLVDSTTRSQKRYDWLREDLINITTVGKGAIVNVQNKFHNNCLTAMLESNKAFTTIRVNALDESGEPNWKEYYTKEDFEKRRELIGENAFLREFQNTPVEDGGVFNTEWLQYCDAQKIHRYSAIAVYTDPSWSSSKKADSKAIATVGRTRTGDFHILDAFCKKTTVVTMLEYLYNLYKEYGSSAQYFIEANFAQDVPIKYEFEKHPEYKSIPLRFDKVVRTKKNTRIENTQPYYENKQVYICNHIKGSSDIEEFRNQLFTFTPQGCPGNDDILDAVTSALNKVQKPQRRHYVTGGSRGNNHRSQVF